ncbi:hypothetical protein F441_17495 [Phytophthora nicotianae CJ01A1]|uniref:Uncharacterized protein n=5 Tax=Phytophthora nicotianae TaxID=4792 RepID=V9EB11_PHYNI|nr:hypothetical protein F443_17627 [Phytophthora nicotianae P1569]ETK76409.1 hypothetical protein L915_17164 [Phytophthora nicotianae]ETO64908.1 hypothetical protein F444_17668 [Phytophthora nicotianae P1976]ETP06010.1 hypothetical protein F441_17495 [Phytophthora nicotianae CJ01A1]ETP34119.1 hypothetical protein F442_17483 [Phytophthora nicotianae P10297]
MLVFSQLQLVWNSSFQAGTQGSGSSPSARFNINVPVLHASWSTNDKRGRKSWSRRMGGVQSLQLAYITTPEDPARDHR